MQYFNRQFLLPFFIFVFGFFSFISIPAEACMGKTLEEDFIQSDLIFRGRLVKIKRGNTLHEYIPSKIWKGDRDLDSVEIKPLKIGSIDYLGRCTFETRHEVAENSDNFDLENNTGISSKLNNEYIIFATKDDETGKYFIDTDFSNSLPLEISPDYDIELQNQLDDTFPNFADKPKNLDIKTGTGLQLDNEFLLIVLSITSFVVLGGFGVFLFFYLNFDKKS